MCYKDLPAQNHMLTLRSSVVTLVMSVCPIGQSGSGLSCCRDGDIIKPELRHPDCFPISLSQNDHIFGPFGERCMEFVRSLPAPRPECNFGPREQVQNVPVVTD
jgi:peroxidase